MISGNSNFRMVTAGISKVYNLYLPPPSTANRVGETINFVHMDPKIARICFFTYRCGFKREHHLSCYEISIIFCLTEALLYTIQTEEAPLQLHPLSCQEHGTWLALSLLCTHKTSSRISVLRIDIAKNTFFAYDQPQGVI